MLEIHPCWATVVGVFPRNHAVAEFIQSVPNVIVHLEEIILMVVYVRQEIN